MRVRCTHPGGIDAMKPGDVADVDETRASVRAHLHAGTLVLVGGVDAPPRDPSTAGPTSLPAEIDASDEEIARLSTLLREARARGPVDDGERAQFSRAYGEAIDRADALRAENEHLRASSTVVCGACERKGCPLCQSTGLVPAVAEVERLRASDAALKSETVTLRQRVAELEAIIEAPAAPRAATSTDKSRPRKEG